MTEMERNERMVQIVEESIRNHAYWYTITPVNGVGVSSLITSIARNAVQAMQSLLGACPRCALPLPQYAGHCAECAKADDHEH